MDIAKKLFIIAVVFHSSLSILNADDVKWPHAHGMNTAALENFLLTAKVIEKEKIKLGVTKPKKVTLEKNNLKIHALFKTFSTSKGIHKIRNMNVADRYEYDITAYKLNQLLGLNMVPVTVYRNIDMSRGALIFWIENALMYKDVEANDFKEFKICPFKKQHSIMYAFDILIHNDDRNMGNILYTLDDCKLWMIDHSRAFRIKNKISPKLPRLKIRLSEDFAEKLRQLDYAILDEHIGKYLNKHQINFMLKRRDLILQKWQKQGKLDFQEG